MLRIRVEIVPDGDEAAASLLAEMHIANDGAGNEFTGTYEVSLKEFTPQPGAAPEVYETRAVLRNLERDILRPLQLVEAALSLSVPPIKRTMAAFPAEPMGEILSRKILRG